MNRREFQRLAKVRLREAQALLSLGLFDGAFYLAGYAVEFGLKACIARGTKRYDFPEKSKVDASHTHSLRNLVKIADLGPNRAATVLTSKRQPRKLVDAVAHRRNGVIRWIKLHW